jgi:hypothetical protein
MTVQLLPGLAVDLLLARFYVLGDVQTFDQIFESLLEQNPQDSLVTGQVAIGAVDGTQLPDTDHLLSRPTAC